MFSKLRNLILEELKQTWLTINAVFGIVIIVASVIISFVYIPTKLFQIMTTSIGSCFGMVILCRVYFKLLASNQIANVQEKFDNESLKKQLIDSKESIKQILIDSEKTVIKIQLERERLERMRIDVTSYSSILNLGLVSVNMNSTDFMKKELRDDRNLREGIIFKNNVSYYEEYIGVVNRKFIAQLGIDMKKLKFTLVNDKIRVAGIKGEFQGYIDEKPVWLLEEIRKKKTIDGKIDNHSIDDRDHRIKDYRQEQDNSFKERLKQGIEFENYEKVIQEMAENIIRLILSPLKKEIVFVNESIDGLTVFDFIQEQNNELNSRIVLLDKESSSRHTN